MEKPIHGIDIDGAEHDARLFADHGRDVGDDAQIIVADDVERDGVTVRPLAAPARLDGAIAEATEHVLRVGAVRAVDLDAARGDEAEDGIAEDGVATFGQVILHAREVLVDHEHIAARLDRFRRRHKLLGAADLRVFRRLAMLAALHLEVILDHRVCVATALGHVDIEIRHRLVATLLDVTHQQRFLDLDLTVLEAPLQQLLGILRRLGRLLAQRLLDLRSRLGGLDERQPVALGRLRGRGDDLHRVAVLEHVSDGHILSVHLTRNAPTADLGVDGEGKVEHGGALGQLDHLAGGREDVDLVLIEVRAELLHQVHRVGRLGLEHGADVAQELVQPTLLLHPFILPMRRQTAFGDLVHAARADLHLYPAFVRP